MPSEPFFQKVFLKDFNNLPHVLKHRYHHRPFSNDRCQLYGSSNIKVSLWGKVLSPFLKTIGALVPYSENHVNVEVKIESHIDNRSVKFIRTFHYSHYPTCHRSSLWVPLQDNEVIEFMKFGLGWKMKYHYHDSKVRLTHVSYVLKLGRFLINIPLEYILGIPYAYEQSINNEKYFMYLNINHPWFGEVFNYQANFIVSKDKVND